MWLVLANSSLALSSEAKLLAPGPLSRRQSCGADSLFVCFQRLGVNSDLGALDTELRYSVDGTNLQLIADAASRRNVVVTPVSAGIDHLIGWQMPAVLHVGEAHFIAFLGGRGDRIVVFDNALGVLECSREWFATRYKYAGIALLCGNTPSVFQTVLTDRYALPFLGAAVVFVSEAWRWRRGRRDRAQ
jgi:ABC-type bacteriocin/lantibiotic exporter with double-glycine peptidase domain